MIFLPKLSSAINAVFTYKLMEYILQEEKLSVYCQFYSLPFMQAVASMY